MNTAPEREIYFSFFMFTADLRPYDLSYRNILLNHLKALTDMGYQGFDFHIAPQPTLDECRAAVDGYKRLKDAIVAAGLEDAKFTTNVGTTRAFDPTSPYPEQRAAALAYLQTRVDITQALGGPAIMSGPFLYPYGAFPTTDDGAGIWSDALRDWIVPRFEAAQGVFQQLAPYADKKGVKLAIEPVKSWETPPPNMVSETLDFLDEADCGHCGVTIDTAQVVMESRGPSVFTNNVARATQAGRLHYVHLSAPDRGALHDSWIPWDFMLGQIEPVYTGPYLVEVFNAIPPFDSSMRMARRRFWRPGEDAPQDGPSAYDIAREGLAEVKRQIIAARPTITPRLPNPIKMVTRRAGKVRFHTFISAFTGDNIANATHIIESENKLVLIDGQFLNVYARQFREYADHLTETTGKPIDRLFLSHRHPDHWFGFGTAFDDVPIYALPETLEFIRDHGQAQIDDHAKLGGLVPPKVVVPQHPIIIPPTAPHLLEMQIDGVRYVMSKVINTEIDFHLIIGIPDAGVCIVQDMVYSGNHLYLTDADSLANWGRVLDKLLASDYDLFLAGHGFPADKTELGRTKEYLEAAQDALARGLKGNAFKQFLLQRYPARLCPGIFDIYLPRLFSDARQY